MKLPFGPRGPKPGAYHPDEVDAYDEGYPEGPYGNDPRHHDGGRQPHGYDGAYQPEYPGGDQSHGYADEHGPPGMDDEFDPRRYGLAEDYQPDGHDEGGEPGPHPGSQPAYDLPEQEYQLGRTTGEAPPTLMLQRQRGRVEHGVGADEFASQMERLRSEATAEQRTAWAYLGLLTGLFVFLVVFGYGCSDAFESEVATGEAGQSEGAVEPAGVLLRIDGDTVTLEGAVPDEAVRTQLATLAEETYGAGNVVNELTIATNVTLDNGTVRTIGAALTDDARARALHDAVGGELGLSDRGFEVGFADTILSPVSAQVEVGTNQVVLVGSLPDQASVDALAGLANEVWGENVVDATGLTAGATTWEGGAIRLVGTIPSTDLKTDQFVGAVADRIGQPVTVDTAGLVTEDLTELLQEVEQQVSELLAAGSIQFGPESSDIEPGSDPVLTQLAELFNQVPTNIEVVGHTDSAGDEQENLLLSQQRAQAVVDRLVALGVAAERLTSRGEGESSPVADNGTDEGRAANRRIEFLFVGADVAAGGAVGESEGDADTTSTTEG
jgi:outer membrane protein OmpA-like peptidoglycan-associated protein